MEIQQRRIYPPEFKAEAVKLVLEQGYSNGKAAHELGLPTKTLANWVRDARRSAASALPGAGAGAGAASGDDDPVALRARIRELERRLAQAQTEKAFLPLSVSSLSCQYLKRIRPLAPAEHAPREGFRAALEERPPLRVKTTDAAHSHPAADNLLERDFHADLPDRRWCCDLTCVPTAEDFLYVACVPDLFSRKVVGWAMDDHLRAELCLDALEMAVLRRRPLPGVLHHSDRGVRYACEDYRAKLEEHGMVRSMSRKGDCYDNAAMESFMGTLKTELIYQESYASREEAKASIFEYIEVFYNRKRLHSSLGYVSPEAFEARIN